MFIVDTSAWIFALRKNPLPQLKDRIDQLLMLDIVKTFGMIRLEILGGAKTEIEFDRLKNRIGALEEISCDNELWESAEGFEALLKQEAELLAKPVLVN